MRIITKDGQEKHAFINSTLVDWDDKPATLAMLTDITEQERMREELKESEERFRKLMEQSPMPIEILSLDGKILQTNPSWNKLWGIDDVVAAETMEKYNMLNDPQLKKLGINHLVEKAFSGEHTILPPIIYDAVETAEDFGIEHLPGLKSPWIQCHLYPIKDKNDKVVNIINTHIDISALKNTEAELRNAYEEIKNLKDRLEAESAYLQDEIKLEHNFKNIIGQSESLKYVLHRVEQVAPTDSPVLIMGETGTGKELITRALHELSPYGKRALVKVNCAALPGELIESELFGREKGAFTGATTTQIGRFELAKGSTLFLDEIGELPLELQAKLLRVLESGEFEKLGSSRTLRSDARIIAATNRVLEEEVRKGRFREDLWYRLKVFPITVPPLREHPEDIPQLVKWFVDQLARKMGKRVGEIPKRAMEMLQNYPWPGNVRELKHAVESALITAQGKKLNFEIPQAQDTERTDFKSFDEMERDYILRVLKAKNWRIGGKGSAASALGMHVNTLRGRMKKLGIKKPTP
jgi:transcriptional regulator with GAF, ATPase, and Fis domain